MPQQQDPALANTLLHHSFLHITAENPSPNDIKALLMMPGANANLTLDNGRSLLAEAVINANLSVATLLYTQGANIETAITQALSSNPTSTQVEAIRHFLLELGLTSNEVLVLSIEQRNVKLATLCIKNGADKKCLSERQENGETLLYSILKKEKLSTEDEVMFNFLCDPNNTVDPNIASTEKLETPAVLLARSPGKFSLLEPLLKIGATLAWPGLRSEARNAHNHLFIQALNKFESETKHEQELKYTQDEQEAQKRLKTQTLITETGHILGLSTSIGGFKTEGAYMFESYSLLQRNLNQFYKTNPELKKHFAPNSPIQEALNLAIQYLDGNAIAHDFLAKHSEGKPIIIPVDWKEKEEINGHAITLIVLNDILVVCNRGDKKLDEAISVFAIPDGTIIASFLEAILPKTEKMTPEKILAEIQKLINHGQPILTFPSQDQKHGTCGFVNVKSSIQPLLCFLELLESTISKSKFTQLNSTLLNALMQDGTPLPPLQTAMHNARTQYKMFTNEMRNSKITDLCEGFKKLPQEPSERKLYYELFDRILAQHPGKDTEFEFWLTSTEIPDDVYADIRDGRRIMIQKNHENDQFIVHYRHRKDKETTVNFVCSETLQEMLLPFFSIDLPCTVNKDWLGQDVYKQIEKEIKLHEGYIHHKNPEKRLAEKNRNLIIFSALEPSLISKDALLPWNLTFSLKEIQESQKAQENQNLPPETHSEHPARIIKPKSS